MSAVIAGERLIELGTIGCYSDLLAAFRAQVANLNITYGVVDQITGYADTYTTKVLAELPARHFTATSLDAYLQALCIRLVAYHDAEKYAKLKEKYQDRLVERVAAPSKPRGSTAIVVHQKFSHRHMKKIGRVGGANSRKYLTPEVASELGKRASMARWHASEPVEVVPA